MHMPNSMRGSYFNAPDFKVVGIMSHGPLGGGGIFLGRGCADSLDISWSFCDDF